LNVSADKAVQEYVVDVVKVPQSWWRVEGLDTALLHQSTSVRVTQHAVVNISVVFEGEVQVVVRGVDLAGNMDPNPPSTVVVMVPRLPVVSFSSQPAALVSTPNVTFAVAADAERGLLAAVWLECSPVVAGSPVVLNATDVFGTVSLTQSATLRSLPSGAYNVTVTGVDVLGRRGPASTVSFVVDVTPPSSNVSIPPAAYIPSSTLELFVEGFDQHSPEGLVLYARVDGGPWAAVPPGDRSIRFASLIGGLHEAEVMAVDGAGNAQPAPYASAITTVDTVPPVVALRGGSEATTIPHYSRNVSEPLCVVVVDTSPVTVALLVDGAVEVPLTEHR
jgi:hypothetical protein